MHIKEFNPSKNYQNKINDFIFENEKNKKNLNILEFGVREGRSTKYSWKFAQMIMES